VRESRRDFLREVIRNPRSTGAVAPSSKQLLQEVMKHARLAAARCVVELGPGTGAFTGAIRESLSPGARYVAVELNPKFAERLRAEHPGIDVHEGSAAEIAGVLSARGERSCDRIISGIPWTVLPPGECEDIVGRVAEVLEPSGLFLTLAYFPMNRLPRGRALRKLLERHFSAVEETDVVPANIPPAFVYVCRR
jgi:phosphatidylethanolamine/phosphatidyl-N-methylethanolamine N-methyltransferase